MSENLGSSPTRLYASTGCAARNVLWQLAAVSCPAKTLGAKVRRLGTNPQQIQLTGLCTQWGN